VEEGNIVLVSLVITLYRRTAGVRRMITEPRTIDNERHRVVCVLYAIIGNKRGLVR